MQIRQDIHTQGGPLPAPRLPFAGQRTLYVEQVVVRCSISHAPKLHQETLYHLIECRRTIPHWIMTGALDDHDTIICRQVSAEAFADFEWNNRVVFSPYQQ